MVDAATKAEVGKIGMLKTKAGPRDGTDWVARRIHKYHHVTNARHYNPLLIRNRS